MRTLASLTLLLLVSGGANAREVEDQTSCLDARPIASNRMDRSKREKEPTVAAKYDASYPTRDVNRLRKLGSI